MANFFKAIVRYCPIRFAWDSGQERVTEFAVPSSLSRAFHHPRTNLICVYALWLESAQGFSFQIAEMRVMGSPFVIGVYLTLPFTWPRQILLARKQTPCGAAQCMAMLGTAAINLSMVILLGT